MVNPIDWNAAVPEASTVTAKSEDTSEFLDFPPLDAFSFKIIDVEDFWPLNPPELRLKLPAQKNLP